jgi:hypothetical protein
MTFVYKYVELNNMLISYSCLTFVCYYHHLWSSFLASYERIL